MKQQEQGGITSKLQPPGPARGRHICLQNLPDASFSTTLTPAEHAPDYLGCAGRPRGAAPFRRRRRRTPRPTPRRQCAPAPRPSSPSPRQPPPAKPAGAWEERRARPCVTSAGSGASPGVEGARALRIYAGAGAVAAPAPGAASGESKRALAGWAGAPESDSPW